MEEGGSKIGSILLTIIEIDNREKEEK